MFDVTAGGLYRIGWNAIQSAQLPLAALPASELQVSVNGQPVATYVNTGGDTLADGDAVLFYAPDADAPQTCTLSLSTNAVAMDMVFARPSRAAGDVQYGFAGSNQVVRFQATTNFVRYLLADFATSPVWVLDMSDAARCRLLYGFTYLAGADGLTGVYLSYPGLTDTTFCLAVGDGGVHEVTNLRRTP